MNTFTKLTKRFATLGLVAVLGLSSAVAQEEDSEPTFSLSGSVDTYYRFNLNSTNDPANGGTLAPGSSFANNPGFALGMANLIASFEGEKVGFVADLVFGPRGADAVLNTTSPSANLVNQMYVYWNVSDDVTLTFGNFNTFLGYEVISPTANYNYSTSYMFSNGPFSHSGLKADIALGDASLMLGVFNQTDFTDFNSSDKYVGGAQLGYGGAYLNFLVSDGFYQIDLTAGMDLTDAVYVGVNATTAKDSFYGAAVYLQNSFSDDFSVGVRGEYFSDKGLGLLTLDENVIDLTLSANYAVGPLTFIPEFRVDLYSETGAVVTDASTATPETAESLASFVLAAVYAF